jgi:hypothetical protein
MTGAADPDFSPDVSHRIYRNRKRERRHLIIRESGGNQEP